MKIYFDINGVIEWENGIAPHIKEFLLYVADEHELYWLTTHCNGDSEPTLKYLKTITKDEELLKVFAQVKPTTWSFIKPEGISYDGEFVWYDDKPTSENEENFLRERGSLHRYRNVDLKNSPSFWQEELNKLKNDKINCSRIVKFLRGQEVNSGKKTINDIWKFTTEELEETHDYIQWLFPLCEWSEMVPGSPYLEPEDVEIIKSDEVIQENILQSLSVMHTFYANNDHWLQKGDHNHYRISRVIRSISLLNNKENAREFYDFILERVEEKMPVTFESLKYWEKF